MSEQNVREAEQAADEWTKDNPYRAVVRPAFISGYQAAQAALTSSPSEPLAEVEELVAKIRAIMPEDDGYFNLKPEEAAALITARDAQVAARVREELAENLCEKNVEIARLNKALDSVIQSFDAVVDAISRGGEAVVPVEMFMAVNKARAALTATGGWGVTEHDLKTWPGPFQDMWLGLKDYEVRRLDRDFAPGDSLVSREWHCHVGYTGRVIRANIKHILPGGFGLQEGLGVLGLFSFQRFENGLPSPVPSPGLSDQLDSTPLTVEEKP